MISIRASSRFRYTFGRQCFAPLSFTSIVDRVIMFYPSSSSSNSLMEFQAVLQLPFMEICIRVGGGVYGECFYFVA